MIDWLEGLSTLQAGIVVVGGFVSLSLVVGYLVGRFTSHEIRTAHNDRAGFILAVIGVIYAVLLAFVAIGVWDRFQQAQAGSFEEADALATVYRDAGSFAGGARLRGILRAYASSVANEEWDRMRRGERIEISSPLLEQADREIRAFSAPSGRLADIQSHMLSAIDTALGARETRLTVYAHGINAILWMVLIVGAIVTVGFTYLFGFDKTLMQQLMIGGLSFLIGLVLFMIVALDFPFRGGIAVGADAFRGLLETFAAIGP